MKQTIALDIETIPNTSAIPLLPEPEVTDSRRKDPDKIAAHLDAKRAKQRADMALDPTTGRICSFAITEISGNEQEFYRVIPAAIISSCVCIDAESDGAEAEIVAELLGILALPELRIVTWDGMRFDLPYIYKRAMLLSFFGSVPAGVPPLTYWTKRYSTTPHCDLAKVWTDGAGFIKLDTVARLMFGGEGKIEIDFTDFPELIKTEEGRQRLGAYNLQDTRLTARIFERASGCLFA